MLSQSGSGAQKVVPAVSHFCGIALALRLNSAMVAPESGYSPFLRISTTAPLSSLIAASAQIADQSDVDIPDAPKR